MVSIVTKRFIQCHDYLKEQGVIRSSRQFALDINYLPQNLNKVLKGDRDIPMEAMRSAIEVFNINPVYLYTGKGKMVIEEDTDEFRLLTIVTDNSNNEKIVHVPVPAQAGYAAETIQPDFVSELPAYSLPGYDFQYGTFRSFDVNGDSMVPYLLPGDKVVCRFVEPREWGTAIKDHHVYVIVSRGAVVIKRVVNNLARHRHLLLISDNDEYQPYRLNINDLREIWYVKTKISVFDHSTSDTHNELNARLNSIQVAFEEQKKLLEKLVNERDNEGNNGNGSI
ncbi:S24 family peptidase [Membranihabitans maritimus]|uniref:S24 family peptidase n=1 Tax=Membranihabitans maritimus TaxID=2904244 RepID=UPI001F33FC47|nr:LexA family transcriptional regulator [Membranihabitans maritimus]